MSDHTIVIICVMKIFFVQFFCVFLTASHSVMSNSLRPCGLYSPWNSPGQNTAVGSLSLLQGIFPTQGSNPGLPHCRLILYQLNHKGNPRILEWIAYPFSSRSSQHRNLTRVYLRCRWILYQPSYEGSPKNTEHDLYSLWELATG